MNQTPPSHDSASHHEGNALWQAACAFAARAHTGQLRKDKATPYFSHAARVAMTLRHVFECADPIALAAALLHDTIEDTTTDYDDLEEHFGAEVAGIVAALTKIMILPEYTREPEYDARLAKADWRARLIKLADAYDNLSDLHSRIGEDIAGARSRLLARCTRAIDLARPDAAGHAETSRAIARLESLMQSAQ